MANTILVKIIVNVDVLHVKSKLFYNIYKGFKLICFYMFSLGMGYFASLETKENTPIDMKEEEQGGTRRSTRKRKSALHEGLYNKIKIKTLIVD